MKEEKKCEGLTKLGMMTAGLDDWLGRPLCGKKLVSIQAFNLRELDLEIQCVYITGGRLVVVREAHHHIH